MHPDSSLWHHIVIRYIKRVVVADSAVSRYAAFGGHELSMIALRLVRLLETNADLLAQSRLEKFRTSPHTRSMAKVPESSAAPAPWASAGPIRAFPWPTSPGQSF